MSDRGPQFTSRVWRGLFRLLGVSVCKDGTVTLRSICSFIDTKRRSDRQISNSGVEGNVDKTDS